MSTAYPKEDRITLPNGKPFGVVISGKDFPAGFPGLLTFSEDRTASYSVPLVKLTALSNPVTQVGKKYQFEFIVEKATEAQKQAGYIEGPYIFTFDPPGVDPTQFHGDLNDPHSDPDNAEDTFTATGNDPKSEC